VNAGEEYTPFERHSSEKYREGVVPDSQSKILLALGGVIRRGIGCRYPRSGNEQDKERKPAYFGKKRESKSFICGRGKVGGRERTMTHMKPSRDLEKQH